MSFEIPPLLINANRFDRNGFERNVDGKSKYIIVQVNKKLETNAEARVLGAYKPWHAFIWIGVRQ
jgi:hypothetical protein